ncbi:MAG: hypothetical protein D3914_16950, partial [Candidatus Electrothrix sp. LOE2]|nr:hypothetical protein [Candidatus Electrothrix sp. LOE2]
MNRCSFLFITLLAPCAFTLSSGCLQAQATLPVLSSAAKKAPQAKTLPQLSSPAADDKIVHKVHKAACSSKTSSGAPVILGSKGSISSVKEKVARISRAAVAKNAVKSTVTVRNSTDNTRENRKFRLAGINKHITSKSPIILDAETGETIFAEAPDNPRQPASTIKVLTGMIAIKRLKDNEKVEVSQHAEKMPSSKVY